MCVTTPLLLLSLPDPFSMSVCCAEVLPPIPDTVNVRVAEDLRVGSNGIALYSSAGALVASTGRLPE
jgi:hypothetical protein